MSVILSDPSPSVRGSEVPMRATELNTPIETLTSANPYQCASLLDENGREIPITEEMIMHACDELMKLWQFPNPKKAA